MRDNVKKTVKHAVLGVCIVLVSVFVVNSCDKPNNDIGNGTQTTEVNNEEEENNDTICCYLQGTKWRLSGIFDAKTDTLVKELEPTITQCENCYTLDFDTDSTAIGCSVGNRVAVNLSSKELDQNYSTNSRYTNPFLYSFLLFLQR